MNSYKFISEQEHKERIHPLFKGMDEAVDALYYAMGEMERYNGMELPTNSGPREYVDFVGIIEEISRTIRNLNSHVIHSELSARSESKGIEVVLESIMVENLALNEKIRKLESRVAQDDAFGFCKKGKVSREIKVDDKYTFTIK